MEKRVISFVAAIVALTGCTPAAIVDFDGSKVRVYSSYNDDEAATAEANRICQPRGEVAQILSTKPFAGEYLFACQPQGGIHWVNPGAF